MSCTSVPHHSFKKAARPVRICSLLALFAPAVLVLAQAPSEQPPKRKLLVAFSSYRDRPKHPQIYFYEHDGVAGGKIVGSIDTVNNRSDSQPSLSADGRLCVFASEKENETSRIFLWSSAEKKLVDLPKLNDSPNSQIHPALTGDGQRFAFAAWDRPGSSQRWDVLLYDVAGKKLIDLPGLGSPKFDERMPCVSGDGRWLAYVSNQPGGAGLSDIYLYDRTAAKIVAVPELNSSGMDITPSLSHDGNLVAFVSDRPGGAGGRDVYLFDRTAKKLVPLPGLNSVAHEQTPSLSPDGRYLAFVSERIAGEGERDIFLYDRETQKLLPTPGLNSKREDIDPCVIVLGS
jgi:Tol biopolymer transport system component